MQHLAATMATHKQLAWLLLIGATFAATVAGQWFIVGNREVRALPCLLFSAGVVLLSVFTVGHLKGRPKWISMGIPDLSPVTCLASRAPDSCAGRGGLLLLGLVVTPVMVLACHVVVRGFGGASG